MSYISITDIDVCQKADPKIPVFIQTTNNGVPLLLITTNRGNLFLQRIYCDSTNSIWKVYMPNIKKLFEKYKLPNTFYPLSHLIFPAKILPKEINIVLVNKSVSDNPSDYEKVSQYNNKVSIWRPINEEKPQNKNIGLVASINKPVLNEVRMINTNHYRDLNDKYDILSDPKPKPKSPDKESNDSWTTKNGKIVYLTTEKDQPWFSNLSVPISEYTEESNNDSNKSDNTTNIITNHKFKVISIILILVILAVIIMRYYITQ